MPTDPPVPTDPAREAELGRVAVWLDPADLSWLADLLAGTDGDSHEERDRIGRVRFRLLAAAHKSGATDDV